MKKLLFHVLFFLSGFLLHAQYDAYQIYDSGGKKTEFTKVLKKISKADIIFFGESHDDPIVHWLELQLIKKFPDIAEGKVIAGAEIFETDNQLILDEYFSGYFDDKRFEEGARLWDNYKTDYKPFLLAAKESGIPLVATNIPRQ